MVDKAYFGPSMLNNMVLKCYNTVIEKKNEISDRGKSVKERTVAGMKYLRRR